MEQEGRYSSVVEWFNDQMGSDSDPTGFDQVGWHEWFFVVYPSEVNSKRGSSFSM